MKIRSRLALEIARRVPRGYARILSYAAQRDDALQDYPLKLHGLPTPLRADLRESVFIGLFKSGTITHQQGLDSTFQQLIRPGDIVFDVGANVGYTTALFAHLTGPKGTVVALEPSPRSFLLLERSLGKLDNVQLLNLGAAEAPGDLDFYVPPMLDRASFLPFENAEKVSVKTDTVDALAARYGMPQVLKVDVEGFELSVFQGARAVLADNNAPIVLFEALSPEVLDGTLALAEAARPGDWQQWRCDSDGSLVPVRQKAGTNDYLLVPSAAMSRVRPLLAG